MSETLLILYKDKRVVDNWVREWGLRLKNVSYFPINSIEDAREWDKKSTYYMVMPDWGKRSTSAKKRDDEDLHSLLASRYREVKKDEFEKRVKKINSPNF